MQLILPVKMILQEFCKGEEMKAYMVWVEDSDKGCGIVFAENRNQARVRAERTYACEDEEYIDIHARRLPLLDGLEGENLNADFWHDEKIRTILVKEYGWRCIEPDYEECAVCSALDYCDEYENYMESIEDDEE